MTQNIKKKSRIEFEKEKFLEEKQKLDATLLKLKSSEIKSQVFKFDMVIKNIKLPTFSKLIKNSSHF